MIRYLWSALILIGIAVGIACGNVQEVSDAVLVGAKEAAELAISMIGVYALWLGLLNILDEAGAVRALAKRAQKGIAFLFRGLKKGSEAVAYITLNLIANMLGMGNAATPFGLKAMQAMQRENPKPDTATHDMCLFIVLNTASVQLIPLSIIAVRAASGSANPAEIVIPAFIATLATAIFGVLAAKICAAASRS